MSSLPPLCFRPLLRRAIWGGRRLESVLGKTLGPGDDYAESWEIVDRGEAQSIVAAGPWEGTSLAELLATHGKQLLGRHYPQRQFPLLLKFLDAHRSLSVQVHPDDAAAARLDPPDLGKTEAWVVLHAEPNSVVYAGLKRGFDRAALEREVNRDTTQLCLYRLEPQEGDCIFIPAGTVHALGAGLLVAEIQQTSDTTFRLFDWNRLGADGKPRDLHVEAALEAIDYGRGPIQVQQPQPTEDAHVSRLVECDHFVLDRWTFDAPRTIGGDDRCHLIAVLEGEVTFDGHRQLGPLARGGTALLPASAGKVLLGAGRQAVLLEMYLP